LMVLLHKSRFSDKMHWIFIVGKWTKMKIR
jgi:hypothetical protein